MIKLIEMNKLKCVFIVVDTLSVGGAEIFALRLSSAMRSLGLRVFLVVLRGDIVSWPHYNLIAKNVDLITIKIPLLRFIMWLDGLLYILRIRFSLLRWLQIFKLRKFLLAERPIIVHSHLLTADIVTSRACGSLGIPWISTMHGDYLALESKRSSRAARIHDFRTAIREIESTARQMVCITDQQHQQLSRIMPKLYAECRITKIYNGYTVARDDSVVGKPSSLLSILPNDAFVIGMVARGIRKKGWDVIISAFKSLNISNAWLVLVGDGDYLQQIKYHIRHPQILFCGNVIDPLPYIQRFDVACLPTQFSTESLPTVIIEYLYLGKPVIATSVGEIPTMLEINKVTQAGLLIDLDETEKMAYQMNNLLLRLYENKAERDLLGANAFKASKKFDMDVCVDAYLDVYERAL